MNKRPRPEPVQVVKQRRDSVLRALIDGVPYVQFMGIGFERRGDELTGTMPFKEELIGNPLLPALHGGATAAFLEVTAIITLSWAFIWEDMESGALDVSDVDNVTLPRLPKTIDFTVDYLRSGLPRDAYARATINRSYSTLCQRPCGGLAGPSGPDVRAGHRTFRHAAAQGLT